MPDSTIIFDDGATLKCPVSPGDYMVWVRWTDILSVTSNVKILDFWELREGDAVTITSRIDDLPPWFELHPTEVLGAVACQRMRKKLDSGWKPGEPLDGPNLWRVRTGDYVIWLSADGPPNDYTSQTMIVFRTDALAYGERNIHPGDLAWFMSFGAPLEEQPGEQMKGRVHAGLDAVRKLGLPRQIGVGWGLHS